MSSHQCPACEGTELISFSGMEEQVCNQCGLVVSEQVDPPSESEFENDTDEETAEWSEFHTVTNETEKQTAKGFGYLLDISRQLELSTNTILKSADILAAAAISNLVKGRSWEQAAAAAVCLAARDSNEPRPIGNIANAIAIEQNRIEKMLRILQRDLEQSISSSTPTGYVQYLCSELNLSAETKERAIQLTKIYQENHPIAGKNPVGVAGAVVYEATDNTITQREIAEEGGITTETIRVRVGEIREISENYP